MQLTNPEGKPIDGIAKSSSPAKQSNREPVWSMDRQVRFTAGLLILNGIALSTINTNWLFLAAIVALGMVISAISNTCALGTILKLLPWNRMDHGI